MGNISGIAFSLNAPSPIKRQGISCYAPFGLPKARLMLRAGFETPTTIARTLLLPNLRPRPRDKILTVGELVASAATGYFVKREQVRFVVLLAKPALIRER